jgi:uncharacterized membrane protein
MTIHIGFVVAHFHFGAESPQRPDFAGVITIGPRNAVTCVKRGVNFGPGGIIKIGILLIHHRQVQGSVKPFL